MNWEEECKLELQKETAKILSINIISKLIELVKNTPNDMDLGKQVRKIFNNQ